MFNLLKRILYGRYYVEILRKVADEEMTTVRFSEWDEEVCTTRITRILEHLQGHALQWNARLVESSEQIKQEMRERANGPQ